MPPPPPAFDAFLFSSNSHFWLKRDKRIEEGLASCVVRRNGIRMYVHAYVRLSVLEWRGFSSTTSLLVPLECAYSYPTYRWTCCKTRVQYCRYLYPLTYSASKKRCIKMSECAYFLPISHFQILTKSGAGVGHGQRPPLPLSSSVARVTREKEREKPSSFQFLRPSSLRFFLGPRLENRQLTELVGRYQQ